MHGDRCVTSPHAMSDVMNIDDMLTNMIGARLMGLNVQIWTFSPGFVRQYSCFSGGSVCV